MFAECRSALEVYGVWLISHTLSTRADHLIQEVRARLRHLEWLFARAMVLNDQLEAAARASLPSGHPKPDVVKQVFVAQSVRKSDPATQATHPFQPSDELWVLLEAFYYSAHRIRDILRDYKDELPGLQGFEAAGVRTVRNHLVEHTSRSSGVLVPSVACGGPVGPQLRLIRWSLDPAGSSEGGLPANAAEFCRALQSTLRRASNAT